MGEKIFLIFQLLWNKGNTFDTDLIATDLKDANCSPKRDWREVEGRTVSVTARQRKSFYDKPLSFCFTFYFTIFYDMVYVAYFHSPMLIVVKVSGFMYGEQLILCTDCFHICIMNLDFKKSKYKLTGSLHLWKKWTPPPNIHTNTLSSARLEHKYRH